MIIQAVEDYGLFYNRYCQDEDLKYSHLLADKMSEY